MKRAIYQRQRIDDLLRESLDLPLTTVVAGIGYGKTTAARGYLQRSGVPYAWITLTNDDPDLLWDKLCEAVGEYNKEVAAALCTLGMPKDAWMIARASKLARAYCSVPFVICLDDYHQLSYDSPVHALVEALVLEDIAHLHILLVSRAQPNIRIATLVSKQLANCLDADALKFTESETKGYLELRGLRLTKAMVETIHEVSDGWISALFLLAEGVRTGGELRRGNIDLLFEENLIRPLPEIDREILFRLSAFDDFPLDMAVDALGMDRVYDIVSALLREGAFVTCDRQDIYRFHPLMKEYLAAHCPYDDVQKTVYRRAGAWYLSRLDHCRPSTVELFEKADCVEELFSLMNKPNAMRLGYSDLEAIYHLALNMPDDMCLKYPFPYLQICFYLFLSGEKRHAALAHRFYDMMEDYFSQNDHPHGDTVLGELMVISRVVGFGHWEGDGEPLEEAARLLKGHPSDLLSPCDPFTFGLPMLLHSEYMLAGELDEAVKRCQYNPYELVTDGFGRGSEYLVVAEAALLRCQMDKAKLFALQAIQFAIPKRQYFVSASAYFTLMRRAMFLGDAQDAEGQLAKIRDLIPLAVNSIVEQRYIIEMLREALSLAECFYSASLGEREGIAPAFLDGTRQGGMASGLGVVQALEAKAMYATGNPMGAMRLCSWINETTTVCQCARLQGLILTALSREAFLGEGQGRSALSQALEAAEPDGIVLLFAEYPDVVPLIEKEMTCGRVNREYLMQVHEQCKAHRGVALSLLAHNAPRLSAREVEVLRLVAAGNTRAQAAEVLYVQENTVKAHLSSIYRKLGAKGKIDAIRTARANGII